MEEIKMYAAKWRGKVSEYEYEVTKIMHKIAEICVQAHADDVLTTSSVDGGFSGCKNIKINIVTISEEKAKSMVEWFKKRSRNGNANGRDTGIPHPF